jgi:hypothetical protein
VSCLWTLRSLPKIGILFILLATETTLLKLRVHLNSRARVVDYTLFWGRTHWNKHYYIWCWWCCCRLNLCLQFLSSSFLSFLLFFFYLARKTIKKKKNYGFPPSFYHPTPNILHPKVTTNNTQPSKIKVHTSEPWLTCTTSPRHQEFLFLPTRTANEDQRYVVSPKFFIIRNKLSYISHRMTAVALGCPDSTNLLSRHQNLATHS